MDCYETPDVPDSGDLIEDRRPLQDQQSEGIDSSKRDRGEIFGRFSGAQLSTKGANYEFDSISTRNVIRQREYGRSVGLGSSYESPLERYQRLKNEVTQLASDLQRAGDEEVEQGVTGAELSTQVTSLLSSLEQTGDLLNTSVTNATATAGAVSQSIAEEIRQFTTASSGGGHDGDTSEQITYELYCKKDMQQLREAGKVAALEKRIARLEGALGATNAASAPLAVAVENLSAKVRLLDETRLSLLQKKAVALKEALESSGTPKLEAPTSAKVEELYEGFARWDAIAQELPALIDRLETLRIVHEKAATVATELEQLSVDNGAVVDLLQATSTSASKLEESFVQNAATIQKNMELLEQRFARLEQQLAQ